MIPVDENFTDRSEQKLTAIIRLVAEIFISPLVSDDWTYTRVGTTAGAITFPEKVVAFNQLLQKII